MIRGAKNKGLPAALGGALGRRLPRAGRIAVLALVALLLPASIASGQQGAPERKQGQRPPDGHSMPPKASDRDQDKDQDKDRADIERIFEILRRLPPIVLVPGQPGIPGRPTDPPVRPGAGQPGGQSGDTPAAGGPAAGGKSAGAPGGGRPPGQQPPVGRPPLPPRNAPPAPIGPPVAPEDQRDALVVVSLPDQGGDDLELRLGAEVGIERESSFRSQLLGLRIVRYRIRDGRPVAVVLAAIASRFGVVAAQPEYVYRPIQGAPGGAASAGPQYAIEKMRLLDAHRIALGRNVRIAIIDTGIDGDHSEIKGALADSFDAVGEGRLTPEPHGTAIAGILTARGQLKGMAPEARIVSVRAFSTTGARKGSEATTTTLIKGIEWAVLGGTRLLNLSFAGPRDPKMQLLLERAEKHGAILVASVGNAGPKSPPLFPAAYPQVIAVSAVDHTDRLYEMAVRGAHVTIAAPGVDILAPAPNQGYEVASGTSMAAAHVSGAVALLLERRPDLTPAQVRELLRRSARTGAGRPEEVGAGIIDAARLLEALN